LNIKQNFTKISGEILGVDVNKSFALVRDVKNQKRIHYINLSNVKNLRRSTQCSPSIFATSLQIDNQDKEEVQKRLHKAENDKSQLWINDNVPQKARQLFSHLKNIYNDDVSWDHSKIAIKVLKCVIVKQPYDESSLEVLDKRESSITTLERVKKILSNLWSSQDSHCDFRRTITHGDKTLTPTNITNKQ